MKIGFLGYGNMTAALAPRWASNHALFLGGRNPDKARDAAAAISSDVSHGSAREAAEHGDVVVLATRHEVVFDTLESAGGASAFDGKIVVDMNNPVRAAGGDFLAQTVDGRSLAERIQDALPGAQVVKAFNTCQATVWTMDPPLFDGRTLVVPLAGNDDAAKEVVGGLVEAIGAEPLDFGDLRYARNLEAIAASVIKLLFSGRDPHTVFNLIQPERKSIA